jgi:hypothetical protein
MQEIDKNVVKQAPKQALKQALKQAEKARFAGHKQASRRSVRAPVQAWAHVCGPACAGAGPRARLRMPAYLLVEGKMRDFNNLEKAAETTGCLRKAGAAC